jgi:hypothetical protein
MSGGFNRALQVRVANRLRTQLASDAASGLPLIDGLSEADQRELCESGGGRLAAVLIVAVSVAEAQHDPRSTCGLADLAQRIVGEVRRTDILGLLDTRQLLLLAPGLDPLGGQSLLERLNALLGGAVLVGIAYRTSASANWTPRVLAAEAAQKSMEPPLLV